MNPSPSVGVDIKLWLIVHNYSRYLADGRWTDSANQMWYYLGYVKYIYSQNWQYISFPNKCFMVTACISTFNRKQKMLTATTLTSYNFQRYISNVVYIIISGANLSIDLRRRTTPAPRQPLNFLWYKPQISLIFAKIADLFDLRPQTPIRSFAPGPRWGDFRPPNGAPRSQNPEYATANCQGGIGMFNLIILYESTIYKNVINNLN